MGLFKKNKKAVIVPKSNEGLTWQDEDTKKPITGATPQGALDNLENLFNGALADMAETTPEVDAEDVSKTPDVAVETVPDAGHTDTERAEEDAREEEHNGDGADAKAEEDIHEKNDGEDRVKDDAENDVKDDIPETEDSSEEDGVDDDIPVADEEKEDGLPPEIFDDEPEEKPAKKKHGRKEKTAKEKKKPVKKSTPAKKTEEDKKREKIIEAMKADIPYTYVYDEMGMIAKRLREKEPDASYSVAYKISEPDVKAVMRADVYEMGRSLASLLNGYDDDVQFQFYIVNSATKKEDFLRDTLIAEPKDETLKDGASLLNAAVEENAPLGHNNVQRDKYIVFSTVCKSPMDALAKFENIEKKAKDLFHAYCGLEITRLTAAQRLRLIYDVENPGGANFGGRAEMTEDTLDLDTLRRMKITTKDLVIPREIKEEKDHIELNGNSFVRLLFINNFPSYLSENLIADLTSVSSMMIYSALYEPLDTDFGFETAKEMTAENTVITNHHVKRTLADQKADRITRQTEIINRTEDAYFTSAALDVLTDAKATGTKVFACSFLIALFADNLSDLDRDTQLLTLSASKFAFQIKVLDYAQKMALQSILPLARGYIDVKRVFPVSRLCNLNALDVQSVLREHGTFTGINAVNDNIILMNRLNLPSPSGLITGVRNAGKTFETKREIFNAMVSTGDNVVVIANKKEDIHYVPFVKRFGAPIYNSKDDGVSFDPFAVIADYGVIDDGKTLKAEFYNAYFAEALRSAGDLGRDEMKMLYALHDEVEQFVKEDFHSIADVTAYMQEHSADLGFKFPTILEALQHIDFTFIDASGVKDMALPRISMYAVGSSLSLMTVLEAVWKLSIEAKKQNRSTWIFVDSADVLAESPEGAKYLKHLLQLSNILRNPLTIVIQNAALLSEGTASHNFRSLFSEIGYFKLLSEGPIERKLFADALNIPNSLLPYITNTAVGSGLILSQSSNLAFNDNMHEILSNADDTIRFFDPVQRKQIR